MWNPPPSWKKNILNFHFDYLIIRLSSNAQITDVKCIYAFILWVNKMGSLTRMVWRRLWRRRPSNLKKATNSSRTCSLLQQNFPSLGRRSTSSASLKSPTKFGLQRELKALGVDENSLEFIRTAEELYLVTWLEDLGLPDCQAPEEEYKRLLAVCVGSQLVQLPGVRLWGSSPGDPGKACRKEKEEKRVHGMVLFWSISQIWGKSRLVTLGVFSSGLRSNSTS